MITISVNGHTLIYGGNSCKSCYSSLCGRYVTIELTKGYETIIDAEDFDKVKDFNWHASDRGVKNYPIVYAACAVTVNGAKRILNIHQLITDTGFCNSISGSDLVANHTDNDIKWVHGLDNRRSSGGITVLSQRDNVAIRRDNTTNVVGVIVKGGGYLAKCCVTINSKRTTLGINSASKRFSNAENLERCKAFYKIMKDLDSRGYNPYTNARYIQTVKWIYAKGDRKHLPR